MSRLYETEATLTIRGDERDVKVRAHVSHEPLLGGCWGGVVDGDIEVRVIVDEFYDRAGTPGRACLACSSAWPANEPAAHAHDCSGAEWVSLDALDTDPKDRERAEEALCEECNNDDSGQGPERNSDDEFERDCA